MIRFGPAGNSDAFYEQGYKHTFEQMKWLHEQQLNAFEYSFGKGVKLKEETANKIGEEAKKYDISLSCHAPYYINLAVNETERMEKNDQYILETLTAAHNMGADRIVVHPGSCSKLTREEAHAMVVEGFLRYIEIAEGFPGITLCCETMGKKNQFGTLDEVIDICKAVPQIVPAVDFGHIYARTLGGIATESDYREIIEKLFTLGDVAKIIHVHFSKIEYGASGEKKHLTFDQEEFGPDHVPLMKLFCEYNMEPRVICESRGTMAKDALILKNTYEEFLNGQA